MCLVCLGCVCSAHPKGVCARESQLQRLQAFFNQEDPALQEEVTSAARELQAVEGAAHLAGSSKLLFLDKLMCHLHFLNCKYVPAYEVGVCFSGLVLGLWARASQCMHARLHARTVQPP